MHASARHQVPLIALLLGIAGSAAAPLAAAAAPLPNAGAPIGVQMFPGAMVVTSCTPPTASVTIGGAEHALPRGSTCYSLETTRDARGVVELLVAPAGAASPPLFVVRRGATVRFRFSSPPQGVVRLEVRSGPGLRHRATYRLSPFATTWRARGTGGVMRLSTVFPPAATPWGESVDNGGAYSARFVVR
jgi:hypothetical protein